MQKKRSNSEQRSHMLESTGPDHQCPCGSQRDVKCMNTDMTAEDEVSLTQISVAFKTAEG